MSTRFKSIPESYQNEYNAKQVKLIQKRIRVCCVTFLGLWAIATFLGVFFNPDSVYYFKLWVVSGLFASASLIWLLSWRVNTLFRVRLLGYFLVAVILAAFTLAQLLAPAEFFNDVYFVLTLFFFSTLIPWRAWEVFLLWFFHYLAWTFYYFSRDLSSYSMPPSLFGYDLYLNGLLYLLFAMLICLVVRHKENKRDLRTFLLLKEVESKQNQMEKELELASRVHNTLIPKSVSTPDFDIAVGYKPMHSIGGDYAKFHFLEDGRLIFFMSDVTGHGVPAALIVNRIHSEFEALVKNAPMPGQILKSLNLFISKEFENTNMYLSAVCGLVSFDPPSFLYSNYGHPSQYLYQLRDNQIMSLKSQATLLGLDPSTDGQVHQTEVPYSSGDKLLLFTDGVLEIENEAGDQFGTERLCSFLKENAEVTPYELNDRLMSELSNFGGGEFEDDIFLLTIQFKNRSNHLG